MANGRFPFSGSSYDDGDDDDDFFGDDGKEDTKGGGGGRDLSPIPDDQGELELDLAHKKTPTYGDTLLAPPHSSDSTHTLGPGYTHTTHPTPRSRLSLNKSTSIKRNRKRRSTGVSLHGEGMTMSILELMHQIVNEPAPRLGLTKEYAFVMEANKFVDACLVKVPEERKAPKALLDFEWMECARTSEFDLRAWANSF